jgi:hypothetical protein
LQYKSGDVYHGAFFSGHMCGAGRMTYANGEIFRGMFVNNCIQDDSVGRMLYANGCKYKGYFKCQQRHGEGRMKYTNGDVFYGMWQYGQISGAGKMVFISGESYVGQWLNNEKHGDGVFTFVNGDQCSGKWINNVLRGPGVEHKFVNSGNTFFGTSAFTVDCMGKMVYKNGDMYEGKFVGGLRQGEATVTFSSGDVHKG